MPATDEQLKKKAFGIVQSIDKMADKERTMLPTELFAKDYNKLHQLVSAAHPELSEVMPPRTTILELAMGAQPMSGQRYCEIRAFCQQIIEFLSPSCE